MTDGEVAKEFLHSRGEIDRAQDVVARGRDASQNDATSTRQCWATALW